MHHFYALLNSKTKETVGYTHGKTTADAIASWLKGNKSVPDALSIVATKLTAEALLRLYYKANTIVKSYAGYDLVKELRLTPEGWCVTVDTIEQGRPTGVIRCHNTWPSARDVLRKLNDI